MKPIHLSLELRAEQALQAARSALMRAQKDTQEAFTRYTSYREVEQQARLAVTNAEKRRDDISKRGQLLTTPLLISFSGYHSSPKPAADGFVNGAFLSNIGPTIFFYPDVRSRKSSVSGDDRRSPPRYPMEVLALNYSKTRSSKFTFLYILGGQNPSRSLHECPCGTKTDRVAGR